VSPSLASQSETQLTSSPGAKKLYHVVRTPTWVPPPRIQSWKIMGQAQEVMSKIQMDSQDNFSQETIEKFKSDPEFYRTFVKEIEALVNNTFPIVSYLFL